MSLSEKMNKLSAPLDSVASILSKPPTSKVNAQSNKAIGVDSFLFSDKKYSAPTATLLKGFQSASKVKEYEIFKALSEFENFDFSKDDNGHEQWIDLHKNVTTVLESYKLEYGDIQDVLSSHTKAILIKKSELDLEKAHDWGAKFRLLFFRFLTTTTLIFLLFGAGYAERHWGWTLPISKYFQGATKP